MIPGRRRAACGKSLHMYTTLRLMLTETTATCHARKVKCDVTIVGVPCTTCKKSGRDDCEVHQKKRRLNGSAPRAPYPLAAAGGDYAAPPPGSDGDYATSPYASRTSSYLPPRQLPYTTSTYHGLTGEEYSSHLVQFVEQPALNERPIDRDARVTYVGTDVSNLSFLTRQKSAERAANVRHHPTNRIARQLTAHEPDRLPAEALQLPEKQLVDRLLQAYFRNLNTGFPVVDELRFMAQYDARDPSNPPSLLLLQSILVAGAHIYYNDKAEREAMKALFFRRAKMLVDARFERNRDVVVQSALLLTWHSDGHGAEDVAANAYFWIHHVATIALGLGMHRDAEPSTLVEHNKRMWRRVFWLLFASDVEIAMQYGRPQAVQIEDCDVQELRASDFGDCGASEYPISGRKLHLLT
jgi:transcriptional regulatory protein AMDR